MVLLITYLPIAVPALGALLTASPALPPPFVRLVLRTISLNSSGATPTSDTPALLNQSQFAQAAISDIP